METTIAANAEHNDTLDGGPAAQSPVPDIAILKATSANRTLDRLRHATADIHADLDQSLDVIIRFCDPYSGFAIEGAVRTFAFAKATLCRENMG